MRRRVAGRPAAASGKRLSPATPQSRFERPVPRMIATAIPAARPVATASGERGIDSIPAAMSMAATRQRDEEQDAVEECPSRSSRRSSSPRNSGSPTASSSPAKIAAPIAMPASAATRLISSADLRRSRPCQARRGRRRAPRRRRVSRRSARGRPEPVAVAAAEARSRRRCRSRWRRCRRRRWSRSAASDGAGRADSAMASGGVGRRPGTGGVVGCSVDRRLSASTGVGIGRRIPRAVGRLGRLRGFRITRMRATATRPVGGLPVSTRLVGTRG